MGKSGLQAEKRPEYNGVTTKKRGRTMRKLSITYMIIGMILLLAAGIMISCDRTAEEIDTAPETEAASDESERNKVASDEITLSGEQTAVWEFFSNDETSTTACANTVSEEIQRIENERYETMGFSPDNYNWAYANLLWNILQTSDLEGLWFFNTAYLDEDSIPELVITFYPVEPDSPIVVTVCTYRYDRIVLCGTYGGKGLMLRTDGEGGVEFSRQIVDNATDQKYSVIQYSRLNDTDTLEEAVRLNCMQSPNGTEYCFIDGEPVERTAYQMKIAERILNPTNYTDDYYMILHGKYLIMRSTIESMFGRNIGDPEEVEVDDFYEEEIPAE